MPKIFEMLGYPVNDVSDIVKESRRRAFCPFISDTCDGGGNRYMSDIDLNGHPELRELFPNMTHIPSGICSIQMSDDQPPWIICPRRLLYMGAKASESVLKGKTQSILLDKCSFPRGTTIGIWSEVKVKYTNPEENDSVFDYTFDYILMPLGQVDQEQAIAETGLTWKVLKPKLQKNGYTFSMRNGKTVIEDFPIENPVVVEVMTSSTSGGDKEKRSCIPQAFEDCMLGRPHFAPGINYRQVWARMASQLIVKSQAAMAWSGKTIWVLQDLLADYISSSTALNLHRFIAEHTDEVNILAFSYADKHRNYQESEPILLDSSILYAGPIRSTTEGEIQPCFQDIVLASVCPPRSVFLSALCKKNLANRIRL